jgi:penicillin-binding protein 2
MDLSDLISQNSEKINFKTKNKYTKHVTIDNINLKKEIILVDKRLYLIAKLFLMFNIIILVGFIYRAYSLQIDGYEKYNLLSLRNYLRSEVVNPSRGIIYDRNNEILVKNIPKYVLNQNINKCVIVKNRDFSSCLSQLQYLNKYIEIDVEFLSSQYGNKEIITIKRDLTKDEALLIGSLREVDSIEVSILPQREYSYPISMSHVLGYVGQSETKVGEYEGKVGVEKYYNTFLAGIPGSNIYKADSFNNKIDTYQQITPIAGKDIKLTLDAKLQNFAFNILEKKVKSMSSAVGGVIIAQNPKNGDILALVNYPTFDLNKISRGISNEEYQKLITQNSFPFLNRAISGVYPPGSVFKIVTASGILEEGVAKPEETIFDEGFIKIGESVYGNWKRDGHGVVDYTRSMKVSNDTYYYIYSGGYKIPKGLGIAGIYDWSKKYKLGETQGIDLPGESVGFIPDGKYKTWYLGDTFISAIGQGDVLSTPLQMSVLMSYYANNQKALVPRVVLEADTLVKKEKILYENLLSNSTFQIIKNSLKEVNRFGGTAFPFFDFPNIHNFESAGKTGTSEYFDSRYGKILTHAWYSGFAPYDEGEIVVTVFLESGGGGSTDAAPLAREIMDYYFQNKTR